MDMKKNSQQQSNEQRLVLWDLATHLGVNADLVRQEFPDLPSVAAGYAMAAPKARDWDGILATLEGAIGLLREIIAARKKQQAAAATQPVGA